MCHDPWIWSSKVCDLSSRIQPTEANGRNSQAISRHWSHRAKEEFEKGGKKALQDDLQARKSSVCFYSFVNESRRRPLNWKEDEE